MNNIDIMADGQAIFQFTPYAGALGAAILLSFIIIYYSMTHEPGKTGSYLIMLITAVIIWCFFRALESMALNPEHKIFFSKMMYMGSCATPPLFLLFTLSYGKFRKVLKQPFITIIWIMPVLIIVMALSNASHHLLWDKITITDNHLPFLNAGPMLELHHGAGFWAALVHNYILMGAGSIILIYSIFSFRGLYKKQTILMTIGVFIPFLCNALYVTGYTPFKNIDVTPFAFTATTSLFAIAIFRYRLIDLIPIAHDDLFKAMDDPAIVLDRNCIIIDYNQSASLIAGISAENLGQHSFAALPFWEGIDEQLQRGKETSFEYRIKNSESTSWYDIKVTCLSRKDNVYGYLIMMRDISKIKTLEQDISRSRKKLKDEILRVRQIQASFFPDFRKINNMDIAGTSLPATELSGDFTDYIKTGDNLYTFILCDVTDHGIVSGYVGFEVRSLFRKNAENYDDPTVIMQSINSEMARDFGAYYYFASIIIFTINTATGKLKYASAGHPPFLIYRNISNSFEELGNTGPLAGFSPSTKYTGKQTTIGKNDILLFYTDGIAELINTDKEMFGIEGLKKSILSTTSRDAQDILINITHNGMEHADYNVSDDDITLVCIIFKD